MTPDYSAFGARGAELLNRLAEQARRLTEIAEEVEELEAEATDDRRTVTVRVTVGGSVRSVTIHPVARRLTNETLGELIVETTNSAFAKAHALAAEHAGKYYAAQRNFNEELRRHDPTAAAAFTELTNSVAGAPAPPVPAGDEDDDPRHPWPAVFDRST
ncbi:YbaB/EbfC family nucleoid-associated protein [Nocardia arthritidis]|uniref:YbaB/EbfC family DNA-binding protein n=1 Tax=Nocardia arthritidis TaxID=228602 RepID=A0A6G9Y9H4_9NOCA|nr:YbaB/EbfC family nucleoid-associated protein [Nocardia arthritidis]QIS09727.1 hypothetical protein F5544_09130 [Nocardia arthritidis]